MNNERIAILQQRLHNLAARLDEPSTSASTNVTASNTDETNGSNSTGNSTDFVTE